MAWSLGWSESSEGLDQALELAQKAIALDDVQAEAHCLLGNVYLWKKRHEKAIEVFGRAIDLNPNYSDAIAGLGNVLTWSGRPEEAIELIERAMRLDPRYPPYYLFYLGHAFFLEGRFDEAIEVLNRALIRNPNFHPAHLYLALSYSQSGRPDKARNEVAKLIGKKPKGPQGAWKQKLPYKDKAVLDRIFGQWERLFADLHKERQ
jgi:tetratricopeptide (TPR) repeat protein